jgi:hypothetical protein
MRKRVVLAGFTLAVLRFPEQVCAQFTDPHTYDNTPVGVNRFELNYGHAHSNTSIDTALVVAGARLNLNQGTLDYTRYFGFLHRLAWVEPIVPLGGLDGSITGTNIHGSSTGAGDSSCEIPMLLRGGPALDASQFANYKPATTIGVSFTITAPTGQYDPDKLLNLGSDRWSFKPEIGVSHPFGPEQKWELNAYANAYFYTDNTSYRGAEVLRQEALPGIEGHVSYSFTNNLWASLDTRYSFRGDTFVNGVNQNDPQENFTLGSELNVSLNPQNALVFEVGRALVHRNGSAFTGFAVRYDYSWARSYR